MGGVRPLRRVRVVELGEGEGGDENEGSEGWVVTRQGLAVHGAGGDGGAEGLAEEDDGGKGGCAGLGNGDLPGRTETVRLRVVSSGAVLGSVFTVVQ